ncbi:MAG: transcriptional regulator NrdR [Planctomycetota bacterium]
MRCPYCNADDDKVVDSRAAASGAVIRRRRECVACGRRFTTYERIEETPLRIIKKDGQRQDFDRNKLLRGLRQACWKRDHIADSEIEGLVTDVEQEIFASGEGEVSSRRLGDMVMERLRRLDQVAFVRFASVYREFKDVGEFVSEVDSMRERELNNQT